MARCREFIMWELMKVSKQFEMQWKFGMVIGIRQCINLTNWASDWTKPKLIDRITNIKLNTTNHNNNDDDDDENPNWHKSYIK